MPGPLPAAGPGSAASAGVFPLLGAQVRGSARGLRAEAEAGGDGPEAGSRKPAAGRDKPEGGGEKPEAGDGKPEGRKQKGGPGAYEAEAGSPEQAAGT